MALLVSALLRSSSKVVVVSNDYLNHASDLSLQSDVVVDLRFLCVTNIKIRQENWRTESRWITKVPNPRPQSPNSFTSGNRNSEKSLGHNGKIIHILGTATSPRILQLGRRTTESPDHQLCSLLPHLRNVFPIPLFGEKKHRQIHTQSA